LEGVVAKDEKLCAFCLRNIKGRKSDACAPCEAGLDYESGAVAIRGPVVARIRNFLMRGGPVETGGYVSLDAIARGTRLSKKDVLKVMRGPLKGEVQRQTGYKVPHYKLRELKDSVNKAIEDILNGVPIKPTIEKLAG
jgi:hypothetical protein